MRKPNLTNAVRTACWLGVPALLLASLSGCEDFGGGAAVVPEVVVLPAEMGGADSEGSGTSGTTDTGTTTSSSGGIGTFKGKVVMTGSMPNLPLPLLFGQGADVKDKAACAREDMPDEKLIVNTASGNGVANVFVYLAKAPKGAALPPVEAEPLVYDQVNCRFTPHCMIVPVGRAVKILNDDPVAHNAHILPLKNPEINQVVGAKERTGILQVTYAKVEKTPIIVKCDYHTWMAGYHLPIDHPFAAVSDENGEFEIPNLPAGDYEFVVWHELAGYVHRKFEVSIAAGDPVLQEVDFPAPSL